LRTRNAGVRQSCQLLWALVLLSSSCTVRPVPTTPEASAPALGTVMLPHGHPLALHLASAGPSATNTSTLRPLVVFATGDGGWRGVDVSIFHKLAAWGYPAVGFSSPEYVKYLPGENETTTPFQLAVDYAAIVDKAQAALGLPETTPVVIVGVSRGAGLAVVAAGQRALRDRLAGVIAIALTREEEHVRWFRRGSGTPKGERVRVMLDLYEYLPQLGPVPISVIQSTRDSYLPAEEARELFGEDTDRRRLHAIVARNHSFSGATETLYETVQRSLEWLDQIPAAIVASP
jgi:pimeloyl-ACP methyl ester carboxylesterase